MLKVEDHLFYGSCDPDTLQSYTPVPSSDGFVISTYHAKVGWVILLQYNQKVFLGKLTVDGNRQHLKLGGMRDDQDCRLAAAGFECHNNTELTGTSTFNAYDRFQAANQNTEADSPLRFVTREDIDFFGNGRQGLFGIIGTVQSEVSADIAPHPSTTYD